ncbi:MAG: flagellar hook protein FlgE [Chthonomonas sp.]|nr:flagellar hook protein FlgE [Chthonomonas sp.]
MLAGVASIKAQQTRMNIIGNNVANVNTTAYKGSRVTFQDMLAQTIRGAGRPTGSLGGTNPIQFGLGVLVAGTDVNNEQGSLNATNRPTDLAIQGNGYFMTGDGSRVAYTRDGAFDLDSNGDMVHRATGERVLGWDFIRQGSQSTSIPIDASSRVNIPIGRLNAVQATTKSALAGNLSGYHAVGSDPRTAPGVADWTTKFRVFDGQGGSHDVSVEFFNRQEAPFTPAAPGVNSRWQWRVMDGNGVEIAQSDGASPEGAALDFDVNGNVLNGDAIRTVTVPTPGNSLDFPFSLDMSKVTQLKTGSATAPESQVNLDEQDGFPPGSLSSFSVSTDGVVTGLFTNGLTRSLGNIAMAIFPNPGGLERQGSNLWRNTDNSGIPVVGTPRSGGRGVVNSGFLEQSNVDIGNEFTDLIITQRGFQANTRVVTTVDEMLQDLINMKR